MSLFHYSHRSHLRHHCFWQFIHRTEDVSTDPVLILLYFIFIFYLSWVLLSHQTRLKIQKKMLQEHMISPSFSLPPKFISIFNIISHLNLYRYVNLSDIQLDIMDYIRPAECKAEDFRSMWAEFEWENKVICVFRFLM